MWEESKGSINVLLIYVNTLSQDTWRKSKDTEDLKIMIIINNKWSSENR